MVGTNPVRLTNYTGVSGQRYTADPAWLRACDGATTVRDREHCQQCAHADDVSAGIGDPQPAP